MRNMFRYKILQEDIYKFILQIAFSPFSLEFGDNNMLE